MKHFPLLSCSLTILIRFTIIYILISLLFYSLHSIAQICHKKASAFGKVDIKHSSEQNKDHIPYLYATRAIIIRNQEIVATEQLNKYFEFDLKPDHEIGQCN